MRKLATGGSGSPAIFGEVPTGSIDDSNTIFVLSTTPVAGTVAIYLNGSRQKVTDDYSITGATITFVLPPLTGSNILADFEY